MFNKPKLYFILHLLYQLSYQQGIVVGAMTESSTNDLKFCIENHTTMSTTLQTFWQDAHKDCELETKRLIELYSQLVTHSFSKEDHCSLLLRHQIRKSLIKNIMPKVEESFVVHSWHNNKELKQHLKELHEIDTKLLQLILERTLNEVYLFLEPVELIKDILEFTEKDLQVTTFKLLLYKYLLDNTQADLVLPTITYHILQLYENSFKSLSTASVQTIEHLYERLPRELRFLYESSKQTIGLLNYGHWEYLYAPRDNGPDNDRRLALTWSQDKNSTDLDGHLIVTFDANGLVAFGSRYGASLKYLYADTEQQAVYFWLGAGVKTTQWWHVIWSYEKFSSSSERYFMLRNKDTKDLLCATTAYDENRRYVTLLSGKNGINNPACHWLVKRF